MYKCMTFLCHGHVFLEYTCDTNGKEESIESDVVIETVR
jgi:hypothetical protein